MAASAAVAKLAELQALASALAPKAVSGHSAAAPAPASAAADFASLRALLNETAGALEDAANRLVLGWPSLTSEEQRAPLLAAVVGRAETAATCSFLVCSDAALCCEAARSESAAAVQGLLASLKALLGMLEDDAGADRAAFVAKGAPLVGAVWEACKQVRLVAKTNKASARRTLLRAGAAVRDMHSEFTQLLAKGRLHREGGESERECEREAEVESEGGERKRGAGCKPGELQEGSDEWYAMMDALGEDDSIDEEDEACLDEILALVAATAHLLQAATQGHFNVAEWPAPDYVAWVNALATAADRARADVDALGLLLYPPHDAALIQEAVAAVRARAAELGAAFAHAGDRVPASARAAVCELADAVQHLPPHAAGDQLR
jgi:hypothetical protein